MAKGNGHTLAHAPDERVAQASRLHPLPGKPFWQRESYDHLIRDDADFARACEYTIQNPVKAGLCANPDVWPFIAQPSPPDARATAIAGRNE